MNHTTTHPTPAMARQALEDRFAARLTSALTDYHASAMPADIDARLRFAHERALAAARQALAQRAAAPSLLGAAGGAAVLGAAGGPNDVPWWLRLGSLVPFAVLLGGLLLIDNHYVRTQIDAAAEVDAAILVDDLPPEAYRDQGFVEYLKSPRP